MSNPAGWYDDPFHDDTLRYWNGETWTRDTLPKPAAPPPATPYPVAPAGTVEPVSGERIVDWLVPSILALLCCAWPLAIPGIVYAVRARHAVGRHDLAEAARLANNARLWVLLSAVIGIAIWLYIGISFWMTGESPVQLTPA